MPPFAYPIDANTLRVVVRAGKGQLRSVTAVFADRFAPFEEGETAPLELAGSDAHDDYFAGELTLRPPRFHYAFLLDDGVRQVWLTETGLSASRPKGGFFAYPYINEADLYDVPDWLVDGVVYQIFPDRFANGNPANDPPGVRPWSDQRPTARSFYGGDLEGIIQRLPHLEELGVTVLYLTPIFASPSNHKYDTTDYYRIDPHFGDEETLKELVRQCHARGIRVMLDAVFNHCGFDFFAFRDVRERGAQSPYAGWFHINDFPVKTDPEPNYETFATGIATMPKLRTGNPEVRDYLLNVARYWVERCDIDGWRLDVANEVDHAFWREFRRVVRAAKPDAAIVGEVWHDALPWLLGDQFDGVTNYPLREACLDYFARNRISADGFAQALVRNLFMYPRPALQGCWNLLGSHDTERFMTACGGDVRKAALAAVFLFTWVGAPLIYYGDEIGMEGGPDPDCRRPMLWERESGPAGNADGEGALGSGAGDEGVDEDVDEEPGNGAHETEPWRNPSGRWNESLFQLYKRLIRLRRETPALRRGEARIVHADPVTNVVAYWRGFAGDEGVGAEGRLTGGRVSGGVVVVLNNSPRVREIPLGKLLAGADKLAGDKPAGDKTVGDKTAGEDQVARERKAAREGKQVTVTVLLDGTRGIGPGPEAGLGRHAAAAPGAPLYGTAIPATSASGTAPLETVSVPPYGAILLNLS